MRIRFLPAGKQAGGFPGGAASASGAVRAGVRAGDGGPFGRRAFRDFVGGKPVRGAPAAGPLRRAAGHGAAL